MDKKNKGFTLVEIIITLAIIVTITTVAVGSYIGISDAKKKEEWRLVKDQIETAAEQYLSSNKYMYETLMSGNLVGEVSVGTLVRLDYLNKVVNPISGNQVSDCSAVDVKIKDGKYKATYDERNVNTKNNGSCDVSSKIIIKEKGATDAELIFYNEGYNKILDEKYNDEWYNIDDIGENSKLKICVKPRNGGAILDAKIGTTSGTKTEKGEYCFDFGQGVHSNISFVLSTIVNGSEKRWTATIPTIKVDSKRPTISSIELKDSNGNNSVVQTSYNSKDVYNLNNTKKMIVNGDDETSGIAKLSNPYRDVNYNPSQLKIAENIDITDVKEYDDEFCVEDVAGNENCTSSSFVIDKTPACPSFDYDGSEGENGYYVSNVNLYLTPDEDTDTYTANLYGNNELWGTSETKTNAPIWTLTADASHTVTVVARSKYGLTNNSCSYGPITLDKTPPACPGFTYVGVAKNNKDVDGTGACYEDENKTSWRCWFNSEKGGMDDSAVAVYVYPSGDTAYWNWYTNNNENSDGFTESGFYKSDDGSGTTNWNYKNWNLSTGPGGDIVNKFNNNVDMFQYWSENAGAIGRRKTLTGHDSQFAYVKKITTTTTTEKNYFVKVGIAEVFDAAGNSSVCPTKYVLMKSSNTRENRTTSPITAKKTTKTKTTKPPKTTKTTNPCTGFKKATKNNIGNYVSVSVSPHVSGNNWGTVWAAYNGGSRIDFTYTPRSNLISIDKNISAVWATSKKSKTSHHNGWNSNGSGNSVTKNTWCDTKYKCKGSNYKHVTSCATVSCGNKYYKKVCYYVNATTGNGEFTYAK